MNDVSNKMETLLVQKTNISKQIVLRIYGSSSFSPIRILILMLGFLWTRMATEPTKRGVFRSCGMAAAMNAKADRLVLNDGRAITKTHVSEINIELILLSGLDVPEDLEIKF